MARMDRALFGTRSWIFALEKHLISMEYIGRREHPVVNFEILTTASI
jgi:hypothetical protein